MAFPPPRIEYSTLEIPKLHELLTLLWVDTTVELMSLVHASLLSVTWCHVLLLCKTLLNCFFSFFKQSCISLIIAGDKLISKIKILQNSIFLTRFIKFPQKHSALFLYFHMKMPELSLLAHFHSLNVLIHHQLISIFWIFWVR